MDSTEENKVEDIKFACHIISLNVLIVIYHGLHNYLGSTISISYFIISISILSQENRFPPSNEWIVVLQNQDTSTFDKYPQ